MGRSQRHILVEHNATSAGEIVAQGEIAPASLFQATEEGSEIVYGAELQSVEDELTVPISGPGGPLSGSPLTGAVPEDMGVPDPEPEAVPVLTSLSPASAVIGGENVTMHCIGSNFTPNSTIVFANQPEPIVFVDEGDISTIITMSLGWGAGPVPVWVVNAQGQQSEMIEFTFEAAPPPLDDGEN